MFLSLYCFDQNQLNIGVDFRFNFYCVKGLYLFLIEYECERCLVYKYAPYITKYYVQKKKEFDTFPQRDAQKLLQKEEQMLLFFFAYNYFLSPWFSTRQSQMEKISYVLSACLSGNVYANT